MNDIPLPTQHPGWIGLFTTHEYPGAYPNGTRVIKVRKGKGDTHEVGATATVLGSVGHTSVGMGYFVEWDAHPRCAVFVTGDAVERADAPVPPELAFLQTLMDQNGYLFPKPIPGGRYYACIAPKIFTHAILVGRIGDLAGYETTWCYETFAEAKRALDAWDGTGEPQGWIRHPDTGRRVSRDPHEKDEDGNEVGEIGKLYRRP